jgi:hypothetical protein
MEDEINKSDKEPTTMLYIPTKTKSNMAKNGSAHPKNT